METAVGAAVLPGLALGGVLALAGAWSRLVAGPALPHLGVGALAGVLAAISLRLVAMPVAGAVAAVVASGMALAAGAALLDRRVRTVGGLRRGLGADVVVLAALLATAALLRPPMAIPLPFGPLGGQPGTVAAVAAAIVGAAGCALLGTRALAGCSAPLRWAAAGGLLGLAVVLAVGAASAPVGAFGSIVGLPDTAGLAVRALAVGLAARRDALDAAAAGFGLGVAETVLAALVPLNGIALVPTAAMLGVGLVLHARGTAR